MPQMSQPLATVLTAAIAGGIGYYIGKTSGLHKYERVHDLQEASKATPVLGNESLPPTHPAKSEDAEWESDSDAGGKESVDTFSDSNEPCKMVLAVRTDLGMTKGKIAAQCGHATLMCYKAAVRFAPALLRRWEVLGQTKVAVQVRGGEEELLELQAKALSLGVVARVVHDAGRTQIAAGSATVLGLGPAPRSIVDQISGHLKLL